MALIVSNEYWLKKGDVDLYVFRKRERGQGNRPVLFLIHGSSLSAIPSYDLHVPGHDDYSVMDTFAKLGFDVWTMDHEGYGRSSRTNRNSDIACAVEDLRLAMPLVKKRNRAIASGIFRPVGRSASRRGIRASLPGSGRTAGPRRLRVDRQGLADAR